MGYKNGSLISSIFEVCIYVSMYRILFYCIVLIHILYISLYIYIVFYLKRQLFHFNHPHDLRFCRSLESAALPALQVAIYRPRSPPLQQQAQGKPQAAGAAVVSEGSPWQNRPSKIQQLSQTARWGFLSNARQVGWRNWKTLGLQIENWILRFLGLSKPAPTRSHHRIWSKSVWVKDQPSDLGSLWLAPEIQRLELETSWNIASKGYCFADSWTRWFLLIFGVPSWVSLRGVQSARPVVLANHWAFDRKHYL